MKACYMTSRIVLAVLLAFSLLKPARAEESKEEAAPAATPGTPASPSFVLVRMTDYEGMTTYKSASPDEFRELVNAAKKDNAVLAKAYNNLRGEWKKTKTRTEMRNVNYGGKTRQVQTEIPPPPFPIKKCPAPREVKQAGLYATAEELEKAKAPLEESEKNRRERVSKEKAAKEAAADSTFIPMGGGQQDMGGLARAVPITTKKQTARKPAKPAKPVSPVSEEDMMNNLIKEIEKLVIENDAAGAATGLRGTDNSGGGLSGPKTVGSGSKNKKKSTPKVIKRMGE